MAFIKYLDQDEVLEKNRVDDMDNIIQIHSINSEVMRNHYDLHIALMRKRSPLSRIQREEIAVVVSAVNGCHY
jgi:alkylhydroperoxidase family enzyme